MLEYTTYSIQNLSPLTLYKALKLRSDVFVVEQECIYPDLDDKDTLPSTLHLTGIHAESGDVAAYARCLAPGVSYPGSSIGRVVVASGYRGQGVAQVLMNHAIEECMTTWPDVDIEIGAQLYLTDFYQSLGFELSSEPYDEDGIMHVDMRLIASTE